MNNEKLRDHQSEHEYLYQISCCRDISLKTTKVNIMLALEKEQNNLINITISRENQAASSLQWI